VSTVSVLIPTYNRAGVLKRAIDSVLSQTYEELECIVIDDASTDETSRLLKSYSDQRLKVVKHEKNWGVSKARNSGFEVSKGEWVALLDSDDEWLPERLERQLAFAKERPEIPLIHGEELWVRNGKRVNPKKIHQKSGGNIFKRCLHLCLISPSATIMKRSLYEEMGGFREDYPVCEDYELWLRVTARYEVGFIPDPIITKYGGHDDQLSSKYKAMDFWRVKAMDEVFRNSDFSLNQDQKDELKEVLLRKCDILKAGYLKHNNLENLPFIEELQARYQGL
jgi:glycosyltransferase involved in cell wall biosynthesis